ncbi:hypothetical protein [Paraliobacillus ryukyuensis]|uniref:hypothetical protein n=1 Tax=Paraliobacillus ryukyuensis TaxID=200904 RepID=UPI0009A70930|nr:hypothetical protein [Paraliobacillus ryukyuensis]
MVKVNLNNGSKLEVYELLADVRLTGNSKKERKTVFVDDLVHFEVYQSMKEWLSHNDHLLIDEEGEKLELNIEEKTQYNHLMTIADIDQFNKIDFENRNKRVVVAEPIDPDSNTVSMVLEERMTKDGIISFLNDVLSNEEVTASTGIENKYTIVDIVE